MTEEKRPLHVATKATAPGESGLSRQKLRIKSILNMTGESLLLGNRLSHVHSSRKSNDLDDGWEEVAI